MIIILGTRMVLKTPYEGQLALLIAHCVFIGDCKRLTDCSLPPLYLIPECSGPSPFGLLVPSCSVVHLRRQPPEIKLPLLRRYPVEPPDNLGHLLPPLLVSRQVPIPVDVPALGVACPAHVAEEHVDRDAVLALRPRGVKPAGRYVQDVPRPQPKLPGAGTRGVRPGEDVDGGGGCAGGEGEAGAVARREEHHGFRAADLEIEIRHDLGCRISIYIHNQVREQIVTAIVPHGTKRGGQGRNSHHNEATC